MYIATQLMGDNEKEELTKIFAAIDKDADGKLSQQELIEGYSLINNSIEEVTKEVDGIMKSVDVDDSGYISYSEFLVALMNKKKMLIKENLREAFDAFDLDRNGYISAKEMKAILGVGKELKEEMWKSLIDEVDQNKDGLISFEEFECMMSQVTT
eukprot:TRINITY_DN2938_c0_g5_i1.p3 TRINITY_DN2938_c0_g5~~TRINITY_DN2938_c0_g5_i1.p3  ORF type:complete len:155 (-),score=53.77 TRINITY_DN2938_c0_g5_i1:68-532(-)